MDVISQQSDHGLAPSQLSILAPLSSLKIPKASRIFDKQFLSYVHHFSFVPDY